jgi:hypothetical protein
VGWINQKGGIEMSDTPRTDAAYFAEGATMYDLAGEAKKMERELNEANADRHRLREALTQAGAGQFLDTISATPPPTVAAKPDADALANALDEANADRHRLREALVELLVVYEKDNTSYDSYGGEGFDWPICNICAAEGKPGIFSCGLPHEESCIIHKFQQALSIPPPAVVDKRDADALREAIAKVAENLRNAVRESHDIGDSYIAGTASELEKALKTYRTKHP